MKKIWILVTTISIVVGAIGVWQYSVWQEAKQEEARVSEAAEQREKTRLEVARLRKNNEFGHTLLGTNLFLLRMAYLSEERDLRGRYSHSRSEFNKWRSTALAIVDGSAKFDTLYRETWGRIEELREKELEILRIMGVCPTLNLQTSIVAAEEKMKHLREAEDWESYQSWQTSIQNIGKIEEAADDANRMQRWRRDAARI
jgi:hypothetical protein